MSTVILDDEFDPMDEEAIDALVELGSDLVTAIMERKPLQEVKDLIDSGAPLWFQDDEGNTALHAAAYSEDPELVRYLIEKGSVWNAGSECCYASSVFLISSVVSRGPRFFLPALNYLRFWSSTTIYEALAS